MDAREVTTDLTSLVCQARKAAYRSTLIALLAQLEGSPFQVSQPYDVSPHPDAIVWYRGDQGGFFSLVITKRS